MFTPDSLDITDLWSTSYVPEFSSGAYVGSAAGAMTQSSVDLTDVIALSYVPVFTSGAYVNQVAGVRTPSSVDLTDFWSGSYTPELSLRSYQLPSIVTFSKSRSLETVVIKSGALVVSSTIVELLWDFETLANPAVPTPAAGGYELLYPVQPVYDVDVKLQQLDDRDWRRVQLTAPKGYDKLGYRIRRVSLDSFISFLEANVGGVVELYTPGVRPFGESFVRSNVRILSYGGYLVETENLFHLEVLYQLVSGIA